MTDANPSTDQKTPALALLRLWAADQANEQCWGLDAVADELERLRAAMNLQFVLVEQRDALASDAVAKDREITELRALLKQITHEQTITTCR